MKIQDSSGVPIESLELLKHTAFGDTGGSQAARCFLFGLVGQADPTGYGGDGALELRRFYGTVKEHWHAVNQQHEELQGRVETTQ